MQLKDVDLNLLIVFHQLFTEKSVSAVAAQLGLTQPAVSNALARLRHQFGDPLLVRTGKGMEPTPRALDLVVPVREALEGMAAAVEGARRFDPSTYAGDFSIASVDYGTQVFAAVFAQRLREWSPRALVRIVRVHANERDTLSKARECQLVISDAHLSPVTYSSAPLLTDDWRVIFRPGHALDQGPFDVHALASHGFVVSRVHDDERRQVTDDVFAAFGLRRRIAVTIPNSAYCGAIVAKTSHVALITARLAERAAAEHGVRLARPPIPVPPMRVLLHWHRRHEASALHRWLRERALEVAASL